MNSFALCEGASRLRIAQLNDSITSPVPTSHTPGLPPSTSPSISWLRPSTDPLQRLMYEGLQGGPQLGPPDAERRQSLGQSKHIIWNGYKLLTRSKENEPRTHLTHAGLATEHQALYLLVESLHRSPAAAERAPGRHHLQGALRQKPPVRNSHKKIYIYK